MSSRRRDVVGTVYLLHFAPRYRHAGHYLGWSGRDVELGRLPEHFNGKGSPLVRAAVLAGCAVTIARTWPDATRELERRLHRRKSSPSLCPLCRAARSLDPAPGMVTMADVRRWVNASRSAAGLPPL